MCDPYLSALRRLRGRAIQIDVYFTLLYFTTTTTTTTTTKPTDDDDDDDDKHVATFSEHQTRLSVAVNVSDSTPLLVAAA